MPANTLSFRQWWLQHLVLPFVLGLGLLALLHVLRVDLWLADWVYVAEGSHNGWLLRHNYLLEHIIHNDGRTLVSLLSVALIGLLLGSYGHAALKPYRRELWMLFCSVSLSILLVRFAKEFTNVSCPWDIQQFGGKFPWIPFPESLSSPLALGQCYPGGHSSGAFAWVALYFVALRLMPQRRWQLLAATIVLGMVFGVAQELRGAHFLSHDLSSLLLSWTLASLCYGVFFRPWQLRQVAFSPLNSALPVLK